MKYSTLFCADNLTFISSDPKVLLGKKKKKD